MDMHSILPQFSVTHINFQSIPLTGTSSPLCVTNIPTADQSLVMIHFLMPKPGAEYKFSLKGLTDGAMETGFNTLGIPGGRMTYAMELTLLERIAAPVPRRAAQVGDAPVQPITPPAVCPLAHRLDYAFGDLRTIRPRSRCQWRCWGRLPPGGNLVTRVLRGASCP
jgi:hypothetical protein